MSTESLRAVKLAQANPGGQYFILDPGLSTSIANRVSLETPNVHFIQGVGEGLPVADASIDAVEINHLFYPVQQAEIIALEE